MNGEAPQYLYVTPIDVTGWICSIDAGVFTLRAGDSDDKVIGIAGRNRIRGGNGNDTLIGLDAGDMRAYIADHAWDVFA